MREPHSGREEEKEGDRDGQIDRGERQEEREEVGAGGEGGKRIQGGGGGGGGEGDYFLGG